LSESNKPDKLPPGTVQKFIEIQEKELEIRQEELAQRKIESQHEYELANKSIEAQERDRSDQRGYYKGFQTRRYFFIGFLALAVLGFLAFALWIGESGLAMRIIEIVALIISGGLGGYAIGFNRGRQLTQLTEDE